VSGGFWLVKKLLNDYHQYKYPCGTCVILDTKIIEEVLPSWEKSEKDQLDDNVFLIAIKGYGR